MAQASICKPLGWREEPAYGGCSPHSVGEQAANASVANHTLTGFRSTPRRVASASEFAHQAAPIGASCKRRRALLREWLVKPSVLVEHAAAFPFDGSGYWAGGVDVAAGGEGRDGSWRERRAPRRAGMAWHPAYAATWCPPCMHAPWPTPHGHPAGTSSRACLL